MDKEIEINRVYSHDITGEDNVRQLMEIVKQNAFEANVQIGTPKIVIHEDGKKELVVPLIGTFIEDTSIKKTLIYMDKSIFFLFMLY